MSSLPAERVEPDCPALLTAEATALRFIGKRGRRHTG